jgi:hypothetical protein
MKDKLLRIAPILLIVVIAILAIAALVSLGQAIFGGEQSTQTGSSVDTSVESLLKTDTERSVKMTVRGPIVADENFRSYVVEISPNERKLITYKGYLDSVIDEVKLENNAKSYDEFVHALNKANIMSGQQLEGDANDVRGICAGGHTYDFAILKDGEVEKNLWTSTCEGSTGSLQANVKQLQNLFIIQIPNNSEIVRDLGVGRN